MNPPGARYHLGLVQKSFLTSLTRNKISQIPYVKGPRSRDYHDLHGRRSTSSFANCPKPTRDTPRKGRNLSSVSFFSTSNEVQEQLLSSYERAASELPGNVQIHLDFFGEPVTFTGVSVSDVGERNISNALASLDGFVIGVVSKGKSFSGGGEEEGVFVQGAHSAALAWAEVLRHACLWNQKGRWSPMLACVAVSPMLAQTGLAYVKYLDHLLSKVDPGVEGLLPIQLVPLARKAALAKDDTNLDLRERSHLQALDCMLRHDHKRALVVMLRHLQRCPGDGFALSLAIDLSHTIGDSSAALRAASSVAAYWNERKGGMLSPSIPGYNAVSALISVGLAVGGRLPEAERLATFAMDKGEKLAGGVATWALAHVLDAEGRTAEGISACANSDGSRNFESCGLLYFDSILSGYGVRFALDREERGRGRSKALRLYDNNYERVFDYTGFASGHAWDRPSRKAPVGWESSVFQKRKTEKTWMTDLFVQAMSSVDRSRESQVVFEGKAVLDRQEWVPTIEDVLTWMPPTPQLLSDATMLLFRLSLNGTISTRNYRWENLRNAWVAMLGMSRQHGGDLHSFEFFPMVCITSSLLVPPAESGRLSGSGDRISQALHRMGELLNLGGIVSDSNQVRDDASRETFLSDFTSMDIVADKEPEFWLPAQSEATDEWRSIFKLLSSAIDGVYDDSGSAEFDWKGAKLERVFNESWEFDIRPVLDHAIVYAACKCGDFEALSLARSICSRGVTLRPNSPDEWWKYSIVLGLLGDEIASEDALQASLAFGGGQGARRDG